MREQPSRHVRTSMILRKSLIPIYADNVAGSAKAIRTTVDRPVCRTPGIKGLNIFPHSAILTRL